MTRHPQLAALVFAGLGTVAWWVVGVLGLAILLLLALVVAVGAQEDPKQ